MRAIATTLAAGALVALSALPAPAEVTAQCSGIGEEERAAAEGIPHTLRLVYAQPDGHYLGGIETRISGASGELISVRCPGPWVLVDLPDGTYRVSATFKGQTKSAQVTISGGARRQQVIVF